MNGRDIINLQEAYLQVYSEPEISEEAQIAAEYFYEQGLDEEDVENLIEELGVDEFNELVDEILESYGIYEASAAQNWIARQILQGMERHKQATQKLGQSKAGKALGSVERRLTTVGHVGFRAAGKAKQAVEKEIEKVKSARGSQTKSPTSRPALPPAGHTSGSRIRQSPTGRLTNMGRVSGALTKAFNASDVGPSTGPTPALPAAIGRPSSAHSKPGTRSPQPYSSSRQTPALPPWGMTGGKKPRALSARERSSRLTTKNKGKGFGSEPVQVKKEDFELWVNTLLDEGYDLSDYTWDDMVEIYEANALERHLKLTPSQRTGRRDKGWESTKSRIAYTHSRRNPETGKMERFGLQRNTRNEIPHAFGDPSEHTGRTPGNRNYHKHRQMFNTGTVGGITGVYVNPSSGVKDFVRRELARRKGKPQTEEYNFLIAHLLDEGYAETLESAQAILNSMSEEWASEILDEVKGLGGYIPKGGTTYSGHYDDDHPGSKGSGKSDGGIKHYYARGKESGLAMPPEQRAELAAKRAGREGTTEGRKRANKIRTRITSAP